MPFANFMTALSRRIDLHLSLGDKMLKAGRAALGLSCSVWIGQLDMSFRDFSSCHSELDEESPDN